ncbi:MAG: hypothetical protein KAS12_02575, partial [Candidatus Aenigmarchaeota archaeon]|nr:hypothetical protein [Candidatus Aenigmarchaeota archaeon]
WQDNFDVISGTIDDTAYNYYSATLTSTATTNGQTINYYLSADGGSNWEAVIPGISHTFTNYGSDLRWKAILTTTDYTQLPDVSQVNLAYRYYLTATNQQVITTNIIPTQLGSYGRLAINNTLNSQTITYQILDRNGTLIPDSYLTGNGAGLAASNTSTTIDLSSIDATDYDYQQLKLKTIFSTNDSLVKPTVDDFTVSWIKVILTGNSQTNQIYISSGATVSFDGSGSVGGSYTCAWDWDNDGVYEESDADCLVTHSFTSVGAHPIGLQQTQVEGEMTATDTATFTVIVANSGSGGSSSSSSITILDQSEELSEEQPVEPTPTPPEQPIISQANLISSGGQQAVTKRTIQLVKSPDSPAVYLLQAGQRQLISHQSVFESWGYNFGQVQTISTDELTSQYQSAGSLSYRDGLLVRSNQSSKTAVYLTEQGKFRPFVSGEVFTALRYQWKQVNWIPDSLISQYQLGELINTASVHLSGTLIKYPNDSAVYLIANNSKRPIKSGQIFEEYGFQWDNIITVPDSYQYLTGATIE